MSSSLHASPLYAGLEPAEIERLVSEQPVRDYAAGAFVIVEGSVNDRIHVVEAGEVAVWKGPVENAGGVKIAVLKAGDCFGEMSVLRNQPTSASLVAVTDARIREIDARDLSGGGAGGGGRVALNLARILVDRLTRGTDALQAKHADEMRANARLLSALMMVGRTLVALSLYVFLLPLASLVKPMLPSDSLISFGVILLLGLMTWNYQRNSGLPAGDFGLNFERWPRQIARGAMWTAPWLALALFGKWIWIQTSPDDIRLFEPERALNSVQGLHWGWWTFFALGYAGMSFAQEYVRAVVQGALALFYRTVRQNEKWRALLIANLVFAILHVHLSATFALLSFLAGLLWGWVFQRERSYLAAATSHALSGLWGVFVVGVPY